MNIAPTTVKINTLSQVKRTFGFYVLKVSKNIVFKKGYEVEKANRKGNLYDFSVSPAKISSSSTIATIPADTANTDSPINSNTVAFSAVTTSTAYCSPITANRANTTSADSPVNSNFSRAVTVSAFSPVDTYPAKPMDSRQSIAAPPPWHPSSLTQFVCRKCSEFYRGLQGGVILHEELQLQPTRSIGLPGTDQLTVANKQ